MKHGSLFNGIGGFQLAADWMGWENIMSCEVDEFCNKVTKKHFPNCIQHGDIKTTDFTIYRGKIDIITGGFPCQPFSNAASRIRKGKEDERHLFPEMLRAIREIQPRWIVGENVYGLINWSNGMVLADIKNDLENEGFKMLPPIVIPACSKNAPHRRERLWIIAHSEGIHGKGIETKRKQTITTVEFRRMDTCEDWLSTATEMCRVDDGLPNRMDRFKSLGNAIVPQVAYQIFKTIEQFELLNTQP